MDATQENTQVFVGKLPFGVREKDVEGFFEGYGRIKHILLKKGYSFVEFEYRCDAADAISELNGKELFGQKISVEPVRSTARTSSQTTRGFKERYNNRRDSISIKSSYKDKSSSSSTSSSRQGRPLRTKYRLIVENLSSHVNSNNLKDFMSKAGEVTHAEAHKHRRNEGVVEFASYFDMKKAMEKFHKTNLKDRRIHLVVDRRGRRSERSYRRSRSLSPCRFHPKFRHASNSSNRSSSSNEAFKKLKSVVIPVSGPRSNVSQHTMSRSRSSSRSMRSLKRSSSPLQQCSQSKRQRTSRSRSRCDSIEKLKAQRTALLNEILKCRLEELGV